MVHVGLVVLTVIVGIVGKVEPAGYVVFVGQRTSRGLFPTI